VRHNGAELTDQQVIMEITSNWMDQKPEIAAHEHDNVTVGSFSDVSEVHDLSIFSVDPIEQWSSTWDTRRHLTGYVQLRKNIIISR
jgi:hypothetical protein